MTLLENDVFMIGMDVVDELSCCFRVDDEIVYVWIIFVKQLQNLKRGGAVLFMPVLGIVKGEGEVTVDSTGSEIPQEIREHAIFGYYIYSWPEKHQHPIFLRIIHPIFLQPLTPYQYIFA